MGKIPADPKGAEDTRPIEVWVLAVRAGMNGAR